MRAAAASVSVIRRLFPRCSTSISIGISGSCRSQWHSENQSRYYFNPHWDYSNRPAGPRAQLNFSPCHPRGSSSLSPPPRAVPAAASLLFFSSLSGTEEEEEEGAVVLDMEAGTVRCAANHAPLSPISFIERAAAVYGARPAVMYGDLRHTWAEVRGRCLRVAAALATRFGVARGDVSGHAPHHRPSAHPVPARRAPRPPAASERQSRARSPAAARTRGGVAVARRELAVARRCAHLWEQMLRHGVAQLQDVDVDARGHGDWSSRADAVRSFILPRHTPAPAPRLAARCLDAQQPLRLGAGARDGHGGTALAAGARGGHGTSRPGAWEASTHVAWRTKRRQGGRGGGGRG